MSKAAFTGSRHHPPQHLYSHPVCVQCGAEITAFYLRAHRDKVGMINYSDISINQEHFPRTMTPPFPVTCASTIFVMIRSAAPSPGAGSLMSPTSTAPSPTPPEEWRRGSDYVSPGEGNVDRHAHISWTSASLSGSRVAAGRPSSCSPSSTSSEFGQEQAPFDIDPPELRSFRRPAGFPCGFEAAKASGSCYSQR